MKAETAQAFAKHFAYLARHYQGHVYKTENTYSAFRDAAEVSKELMAIARKNDEDEA